MKGNGIRINVLALAGIAALMVWGLSFYIGGDALIVAAGGVIGGMVGVMKELVSPEPDPAVPASTVEEIIAKYAGVPGSDGAVLESSAPGMGIMPIRWNLLILSVLGGTLVFLLAGDGMGSALLGIAGSFIGGIASTMTRLVQPPPDPAVPASIVSKLLAAPAAPS